MPSVTRTIHVHAPATAVWGLIGDFSSVHSWMPGIDSVALRGAPPGTPGCERVVSAGGAEFVERLIAVDDAARQTVYTMPTPPFPITDHRATISVAADDDGCSVSWSAQFQADDAVLADVDAAMGSGAFEYGLQAIAAHFARHPAPVWEWYPDVAMDDDDRSLYEGWRDRELRLPRCSDCGRWHAPPRSVCPFCWSTDVVPTALSGRGTVHLSMLIHQGPPAAGVRYPYPVVTVELAEQPGLRFSSTIVQPHDGPVPIGTPVELSWQQRAGAPFPVFRSTHEPAEQGGVPA